MFHVLCACAGLLLNTLSVIRGCELVFDSSDVLERLLEGSDDAAGSPAQDCLVLLLPRRVHDALLHLHVFGVPDCGGMHACMQPSSPPGI